MDKKTEVHVLLFIEKKKNEVEAILAQIKEEIRNHQCGILCALYCPFRRRSTDVWQGKLLIPKYQKLEKNIRQGNYSQAHQLLDEILQMKSRKFLPAQVLGRLAQMKNCLSS